MCTHGGGLKLSGKSRPVDGHSGARETIIAGPYQSIIISFSMHRDRDSEGAQRDKTRGGCSLNIILGVWGSAANPLAENDFFCKFEVRNMPSKTPFSVFLSDGGYLAGPPNVAGPGKLSPS